MKIEDMLADEVWPCVLTGCDEPVLETRALCPLHELRYIAMIGRPSPPARTSEKWHQALRTRGRWAAKLGPYTYRNERKTLWDIRAKSSPLQRYVMGGKHAPTLPADANGKGSGG